MQLVWGEISVLLDDEAFVDELEQMHEDIYISLNDSGINILRDKTEGYTAEEISGFIGAFGAFFNNAALVFLLWTYLLAEKTGERVLGENNPVSIVAPP